MRKIFHRIFSIELHKLFHKKKSALFPSSAMAICGILLGVILSLIGIVGVIIPGIPGAQLGYLGLLVVQFTLDFPFSWRFLIIWGIVNIGLFVIDYLLPIWGTKTFGGTKRGNTGCLIGIFVGIFAGPLGILLGPFLGALMGEYLHQHNIQKALKAAFGAFLGFISGIIVKLMVSIVMLGYLLAVSIQHFI